MLQQHSVRRQAVANPIQARLFYRFKDARGEGVFRDPLMISVTIKASPMKLSTVIVILKAYQNTKRNFQNMTYDVAMTSLLKQWQNSNLREAKQIIYHSKGNDVSFPKM